MTTRGESGRRFPVDALAVDLGIHLELPERDHHGLRQLADQLGVTPGYLRVLRRRGLTEHQADEFAIRAGTHPVNVWGSAWDTDPEVDELDAAEWAA